MCLPFVPKSSDSINSNLSNRQQCEITHLFCVFTYAYAPFVRFFALTPQNLYFGVFFYKTYCLFVKNMV